MAFWAFQFGDGTYAIDTRVALSKILMDVKGHYRDQPFLFLQIVQFCELASETKGALKAAYQYLASHSRQSAEAWRDIVFLPTLGRQTLEALLTPRPKANLLDDVKFSIHGRSVTVMLPDRLYDQLDGKAGLSATFRRTVLETAQSLEISGVRLDRIERTQVGLTPRTLETSSPTIVFPIGVSGSKLVQGIGKLPPMRSRRTLQGSVIDGMQFGPATKKLRGVRIGRVAKAFTLNAATKGNIKALSPVAPDTLVMLVFDRSALSNTESIATARNIAGAYKGLGARVVALCSSPNRRAISETDEHLSRTVSQLRKYLDYWVFVRPRELDNEGSVHLGPSAQDAVYAAVDIFHTCASANMRDELWQSTGRESMKFAASAYMKSSLDDDVGTTSRKLVEQMMGPISVERADTLIAQFARPRRSDNRYQDTFLNLPASFANSLRFSFMERPIPVPKSKRASVPSTALLTGIEYPVVPSKFSAACADILAKNGFKILRPRKSGSGFRASLEGRDFEIECLWSDSPPRSFDRDSLISSLRQRAIICNWPVPAALALRYALDDVLCVSSVNIPTLALAVRARGAFLMELFRAMPTKEFREVLQSNVGGFLTRELFDGAGRYSAFHDLAELSSHTQIESTMDEEITSIKVQPGEIAIEGTMTVEVELNYGKEPDDHTSGSFPGKFFLKITREGLRIDDAEVDTSGFYR